MPLVKHNWTKGKFLQFENRPLSLICWFAVIMSAHRTYKRNNQQIHLKRSRKCRRRLFVKLGGMRTILEIQVML